LSRGDLSEAEWRLLEPLLPPERGRKSRPAFDNRQIVNGILWRIRTGAPWRDLPEKHGKWMTRVDWASLMRRTFDADVLECPRCSGRLRVVAVIDDPTMIRTILDELHIPRTRAPPRTIPHSSSPTTPHRSTRRNPRHRTRPPKTCSHQVRNSARMHGTFETAHSLALRPTFRSQSAFGFPSLLCCKDVGERPMPHFALPLRYHPLRRSRQGWGAIGTEWCTRSGTIFLGHPEVRASLQAQWNEKQQRRTSRRLG
jgi:transposase